MGPGSKGGRALHVPDTVSDLHTGAFLAMSIWVADEYFLSSLGDTRHEPWMTDLKMYELRKLLFVFWGDTRHEPWMTDLKMYEPRKLLFVSFLGCARHEPWMTDVKIYDPGKLFFFFFGLCQA